MKKLKYIIFSAFTSLFILTGCELEDRYYEGEPFVSFLKEGQTVFIDQKSGGKEVAIEYGTAQKAPGTVVTLSVDPASPAKEGTDFTFVKKESTLTGDQVTDSFIVKFLESAATTVAKTAIFNISSSTVKNGVERQKHTVTYSLRCPVTSFVGVFAAKPSLFSSGWDVEVVQGSEPNTLIVKDYITDGYDIVLKYNDAGNVTFAQQATGYNHSQYGPVSIRMASDNTPSTVNFCSRTMNLRVNYVVAAGSFGQATDTFVGK